MSCDCRRPPEGGEGHSLGGQGSHECLPQEGRACDKQRGNFPSSADTWPSSALAEKDTYSLTAKDTDRMFAQSLPTAFH